MRPGPSRTAGARLGEKKDTSDWLKEILAMCASVHHMQFDDHHLIIILMIKILTFINRYQLSAQITKSAAPILRH